MQDLQNKLDARSEEIINLIESSCQNILEKNVIDEIVSTVATLGTSIDMSKGKAASWGCGIVHGLLYSKGLFNKELKATLIYNAFGVSSSTALGKSKEIRTLLDTKDEVIKEVALTSVKGEVEAVEEIKHVKVYDGTYEDVTLEKANKIADIAWKEKNFKRKVNLAKEALNMNEKCAEAYLILSYDESISSKDKIDLVNKAKNMAKETIGEENINGYIGRFLNFSLTKPYISAKYRLASLLWIDGIKKEAINELVGILELCPEDSLMIRGILATWLLEEGMISELESLLNKFNGDYLTSIKFTRALYTFIKEGDSENANRALRIANLSNTFVLDYITRKKRLPKILPELKKLGTDEDAVYYMKNAENSWRMNPKAIDWVKNFKKTR